MCAEGGRGGHLEVVAMLRQLDGENRLCSGDFNFILTSHLIKNFRAGLGGPKDITISIFLL